MANRSSLELNIAIGTSVSSNFIELDGRTVTGLFVPTVWTTANITLQTALTPTGTWYDVLSEAGAEVVLTATQGAFLLIPAALLNGLDFIRVRSGTSLVPVNQVAARVIVLNVRDFQ